MNKALNGARILVTGSSGWLGSETLCYLSKILDASTLGNLVGLSRDGRTLSVHGNKIQSTSFTELDNLEGFDLIIHLAFLLPDNSLVADASRFLEINSSITQKMDVIFRKNPQARKLVLSSGAVNLGSETSNSESKLLYARSKQEMESVLQDDSTVILRLWSATGHHLPLKSNYAIADFINRAALNQNILIRNNVKRSYVHFQSILEMSLGYLLDSGRGTFNSGGEVTSVEKLAKLVVSSLKSRSEIVIENTKVEQELHYISPECELPKKYFNVQMSLESQVIDTIASLELSE